MKKTLLATAFTLALGSTAAMAGGIQIDPTGSGSIAASNFIINPGNSEGNMLAENALAGGGINTTAGGTDVWAHNSFIVPGGELTFNLHIPVTSGLGSILGPTAVGSSLAMLQAGGATFDLYFDDGTGAPADPASGLGYTDGHLIASGSVTVASTFSFVNLSGTPTGPMSLNDPIPSINGNGSVVLAVDFLPASIDTDYVVNDLAGLTIDLTTSNSLSLQYDQAPLTPLRSSSSFDGGAVIADEGPDDANDFTCGGAFTTCDIQFQMNTTMVFNAPRVPEPATLALMGMGLGLIGGISRRRRKSS